MVHLKEMEEEKKTRVEEKRAKEKTHMEKLVRGLSTRVWSMSHFMVCVCLRSFVEPLQAAWQEKDSSARRKESIAEED